MTAKKDICSIYMCLEPGIIFSPNFYNTNDELNFSSYTVYKACLAIVSKSVWTGIHKNEFTLDSNGYVFTFSRPFYEKTSYKPFGSLIINIPGKVITEICKSGGKGADYNIFIIDRKGETIYNSRGKNGVEQIDRSYINDILGGGKSEDIFNFEIGDKFYLVKYVYSEDGKWIYIAETPLNYLFENSLQVKRYIYMILLFSLIMSIIVAYLLSAYFTMPFRKMIKSMKLVEKGNFDMKLGIQNKSEVGILALNFDHMIEEVKNLILKLNIEHELKRKEELNVLQAQITPHFLYNSLNTIKCLASIQKAGGIEEITTSLIELLQLSISKSTQFIHINDEIEITKKYLLMQNFKYGNKFAVKYEYTEDVLQYMTIKMILQPLVENSIFHGIEPGEGNGLIRIRAFRKDKIICLEVEDNGAGMDEEQIYRALNEDNRSNRKFSGIGIKNVNERIKMHFGEQYGLTFKSVPGIYTIATVTIPVIEESEVVNNV